MKTIVACIGMAVLGAVLTDAQGAPPQGAAATPPVVTMSLAGAIGQQYKSVKDLWVKTADLMPADAYAFQPTPEMRTFVAGMGHVLMTNLSQCGLLLGRKHALAGVNLEKTLTAKVDTVKTVADTFAFCDEYFLKVDDQTPLVDTFATVNGRRNGAPVVFRIANGTTIMGFLTHNDEMYGYLSVYLRLKGLVPPSSTPATGRVGSGSGR